jgi:NAD(P)-dependent dehydrogenase (short-subunit alcohol dehydrogenase family)
MQRQVVWVTGASAGIGWAIASELVGGGWTVGLGARRRALLAELVAAHPQGEHLTASELDVCRSSSVARWAAELREQTGEPDALVNSAGWGIFAPVVETTEEDWDRTISSNLKGLFLVTKEVLPAMLARGRGHIVSILSVASRTAFPQNCAYNASKYGALGFTEALRAELRGQGIRVTAVLPGATDTPFWDRAGGEWDRTKMMRPEQIARAVRGALEAGPECLVEEIQIAPPLGNL